MVDAKRVEVYLIKCLPLKNEFVTILQTPKKGFGMQLCFGV